MKFSSEGMSEDRTVGFVKIEKLGKAQQVKVDIMKLKSLLEVVTGFKKMGYEEIVLTVEADMPLIIGSEKIGIALACRL